MTEATAGTSEHPDAPSPPRRPSRVGAGTTQRFVLLAGLFLAGSLFMLSDLILRLTDPRNDLAGCALAAGFDPVHNSPANLLAQDTPAFHQCVDHNVGPWKLLWLPLTATVVVLVLALVLYLLIPRWKGRRSRVAPLRDAEGLDWLAALAAAHGLPRTPAFVVDTRALLSSNAIAFGRLGRYTVRLDLGLVKLFHQERSAFEATMLHEFAHIRNRDVDITYLTIALWRVFSVGLLVPFVAVDGWMLTGAIRSNDPFNGSAPGLTRNLALAAFMVLLMYLTTADLLRTRELHADLDAVAQGADASYWTRQLEPGHNGRPARAAGRAIHSLLRTHPDWEARVATLAGGSASVAVRALPMVLTGVAVEVVGYLITFTTGLNTYLPEWLADPGVWPAAVLATAVGGVAVWRSVLHAEPGAPAPSGLRAGLWLGTGQLAGELAVSQFLGNQWAPAFPEVLLLLLPVIVPAAVLWWTAGCAGLCAALPPGPRRAALGAVTMVVTALAFAWWYGWWQAAGTTFAGGMPYSTSTALAFLNNGFAPSEQMAPSTTADLIANLTIVVLTLTSQEWGRLLTAGLWLVPLLGAAHRRTLRTGAACGLLGGAVAGTGVIAITHRAQVWVWSDHQPFIPSMTVYEAWLFMILLCGAVVAAVAAAAFSKGGAAAAMVSAGSAMTIGLVVLLAINETDGCVRPLATVSHVCHPASGADWLVLTQFLPELLAVAGMVSLVMAFAVVVVARLVATVRGAARLPRPPGTAAIAVGGSGRRHPALRLTGTTVACVLLIGFGVADYGTGQAGDGSNRSGPDPLITGLRKTPVSELELGLQVYAWGHFGGGPIMGDYEHDLADIDDSVGQDGSVDVPAMRHGCTNLVNAIDRATTYFPIPDSTQEAAWTAVLAGNRKEAQACLKALAPLDPAELGRVLSALNPPVDPVATIIDALRKESDPVQHLLGAK
ncbi:M48 family metalloprotease [Kitasatospora sp. GP82]|uniref:M48 family metalloprotease n=1 Tax=Kitasatospora sp. GP82 TaxID=3035089 RepID=UPI0024747BB3|nr:M48 family metalloprotease [Kitasatospora sp. GP82]MDH6130209.1 hypothetical protein [Kitasatospora sp. GP82]